jgi:hypothetical protein
VQKLSQVDVQHEGSNVHTTVVQKPQFLASAAPVTHGLCEQLPPPPDELLAAVAAAVEATVEAAVDAATLAATEELLSALDASLLEDASAVLAFDVELASSPVVLTVISAAAPPAPPAPCFKSS